MHWLQALLLGILQGLTEFLPISSRGHIEIGKALLGIDAEKSLFFTIAVHGATVLSTIVVFYKELGKLISGFFKFRWNASTQYVFMIFLSMVPVIIIGLFFKEQVETLLGNLTIIGIALMLTSVLLFSTRFVKNNTGSITFMKAFVIGLSQAVSAIIPGLSRSGTTISTGIFLKIDRAEVARFSFLMVIIPVIGENVLDLVKGNFSTTGIDKKSMLIGFVAAFIVGLIACKWMIGIIKRGKLTWFAVYCAVIGLSTLIWSLVK